MPAGITSSVDVSAKYSFGICAGREHVVSPHAHRQRGEPQEREHERAVAEEPLA